MFKDKLRSDLFYKQLVEAYNRQKGGLFTVYHIHCDEFLPQMEVDITGGNIELIGKTLQGCICPGDTTALQWQDFLLRYGGPSERLCDAIAELARCLANTIH